jgi:uncharacterized protein (TIGR02118 family)
MTTISVLYPREAGATFDYAYYESTHLPLVKQHWADAGLTGVSALRGVASGDGGESPFLAMAFLTFASMEAFQGALGGPHAATIMGDIPNFTGVTPILQVNDTIAA